MIERPTVMTIFFQKSTGAIKCVADFETDIDNYFVEEADKEDYRLIWDFVKLPYNEAIFNNSTLFGIDLETKGIKMLNF